MLVKYWPLRRRVVRLHARRVRVEVVGTPPAARCQCDGDPGPLLPVTVQVQNASVRLVVPTSGP